MNTASGRVRKYMVMKKVILSLIRVALLCACMIGIHLKKENLVQLEYKSITKNGYIEDNVTSTDVLLCRVAYPLSQLVFYRSISSYMSRNMSSRQAARSFAPSSTRKDLQL